MHVRAAVIALGSILVIGLIAACGDDKAGIGEACTQSQDCEEDGSCTSEGYCSRVNCDESGKGCPSGWTCVTSPDITKLNLTTSSICIPSCSSCPAGTSCHPPRQRCERERVASDAAAGPACSLHEGDTCSPDSGSTCCDGACGLDHYDPATDRTTISCVLACPTSACTKAGWSCHDFHDTAGYDHPFDGEFCLPNPPVVNVTQSPNPAKVGSDVTLTAIGTSPAGLAITELVWENPFGLAGSREATYQVHISSDTEKNFTVKVRDDANQISSFVYAVHLE